MKLFCSKSNLLINKQTQKINISLTYKHILGIGTSVSDLIVNLTFQCTPEELDTKVTNFCLENKIKLVKYEVVN